MDKRTFPGERESAGARKTYYIALHSS